MRCPFCAEEIQDAARLCRFCGASQSDGEWMPPRTHNAPTRSQPRGLFTIKLAGAFFLLSGAIAAISCTSAVPLFGAMRSGMTAICYNLLFAALYVAMGVGLISLRIWGYQMLMAGTALYSIDRLAFLLDSRTRAAYFAGANLQSEVQSMVDMNLIDQGVIWTTIAILICWWGFAVFIYLRRDSFH